MTTTTNTTITVQTTVKAPVSKVWEYWSAPEHIMTWNSPSDDWHTPYAENDLREGGAFKSTMAARDGSMSFDFEGKYTRVDKHKRIEYAMSDGRKVSVTFEAKGNETLITETFDPESINSLEMQRAGWQAILDNFAKYTATH